MMIDILGIFLLLLGTINLIYLLLYIAQSPNIKTMLGIKNELKISHLIKIIFTLPALLLALLCILFASIFCAIPDITLIKFKDQE